MALMSVFDQIRRSLP